MKLYFMMGLPTETDEDVIAIPRLAERVLEIGREVVPKGERGGLSVSISVAVLVPKPHTPFQWCGQLTLEEVRRRQRLLLDSTRSRAIRVSYHDAETSVVEAVLSRSGREAFELILEAWRRGCRFDAWTDQFSYERWHEAGASLGMDLEEIASTDYDLDCHLPWEHTTPGVDPRFLRREWRRALGGVTTPDCTFTSCTGCGICPTTRSHNVIWGERS